MKRKPRSFSLTESGFEALRTCERSYPHLRRGELVSIALDNMARQIEASRGAEFRLPDPEEWDRISRTVSEIEIFHHEIMTALDSPPPSSDLGGENELKGKIEFEVEELGRLRERVSKLAPLTDGLSARDHENLKRFVETAKGPQLDKATAQAFRTASKIIKTIL
jgi:hypothetical protein